MTEVISSCVIAWVVIGGIVCGALSSDSETETRHMVMGFFWPITLAVFLIIGPIYALYASVCSCLAMFKD